MCYAASEAATLNSVRRFSEGRVPKEVRCVVSVASGDDVSCKSFEDVFRAELNDIRERHNDSGRPKIPEELDGLLPSTSLGLTGLACSGGGIRSAAFCLGILQGLESKNLLEQIDYLSTVSGGGYVGTTTTIGMSSIGKFPFGRGEDEPYETPELRHLRDNSRYLLPEGLPFLASTVAAYLRGIALSVLVVLPLLFIASAILLYLNPDTDAYSRSAALAYLPFLMVCLTLALFLLFIGNVIPRFNALRKFRQLINQCTLFIFIAVSIALFLLVPMSWIRDFFEARGYIEPVYEESRRLANPQTVNSLSVYAELFLLSSPALIYFIYLFIRFFAGSPLENRKYKPGSWADFLFRRSRRITVIVLASLLPLLVWLSILQLTFWGTAVSACPHTHALGCARDQIVEQWQHAPALFQWLFGDPARFHSWKAWTIYCAIALGLLAFWPFLNVNSSSLFRLYRNRLESAFLIRRRVLGQHIDEEVEIVTNFRLSDIDPRRSPYHLINTTLNVPGSPFANRRGRNADFFLFSRRFVGSQATGYVETEKTELWDKTLKIGDAMAISGAAAAPTMGMASIRPLAPTMTFLNIRLGRWFRHPRGIATDVTRLENRKKTGKMKWAWQDFVYPRSRAGPLYLFFEAFSKTGLNVTNPEAKRGFGSFVFPAGGRFIFLTDGGHVDNLGIYELLRRRCQLIICIDAEADPDLDAGSLLRVQRFARIDLRVMIRMDWRPIGIRTRAVAEEMQLDALKAQNGPHVAMGLIEYPPMAGCAGEREKGVLVYIKASVSGDEDDYVIGYKAKHQRFPHESTIEQLYSEEQFEVYRALGEHIARGFINRRDDVCAFPEDRGELVRMIQSLLPSVSVFPSEQPSPQAS